MAGNPGNGERRVPLPRWLGAITSLANVVATTWILLIMVLIVADVVGRNAFLSPIAGVPEMVKFSIVGIVFLQVAHTHASGEMIRSDGLLEIIGRTRPRLAAAFDLVAQLLGVVFTVLLAWTVWPRMVRAFGRGEMEGVAGHFELPVWPFHLIIVAGSVLLALSFAAQAWVAWTRLRHGAPAGGV
ncbi:MAG: TRAP transporter small permease [Rhizobiaceae bacterium]|nr:TRAP transporter small permease [Rhizobiaceae bacterium]MCV0406988.1 TRAP transporter small permease [Rhizobiaceae bacterium]